MKIFKIEPIQLESYDDKNKSHLVGSVWITEIVIEGWFLSKKAKVVTRMYCSTSGALWERVNSKYYSCDIAHVIQSNYKSLLNGETLYLDKPEQENKKAGE